MSSWGPELGLKSVESKVIVLPSHLGAQPGLFSHVMLLSRDAESCSCVVVLVFLRHDPGHMSCHMI